MNFSHYSDLTAGMAVELVNTMNRVSGEDELSDLDGLNSFLDKYRDAWEIDDWEVDDITAAELEQVRRLRERLRAVFEARNLDVAAKTLNSVLTDTVAIPRVSTHDDHPHLHFEPLSGSIARRLGAAAAMGLATVLIEHGLDRFGTCAATDCVDAFLDTSRNRSRRHCSTTCANREHVAAHRRRARDEEARR